MTRSDLIQQLASKFPQMTAQDIELAVKTILEGVSGTLAKGGRIEVRGFGSFRLNHRDPRKGRNPKTGASVAVPAKYVLYFRPGRELKERVDGGKA